MKIAVFMGGISSEREVSLKTGAAILKSLLNQNYDAFGIDVTEENKISAFTDNDYDLAFLALHGEFGEDGKVQSLLDILGKKYTGSGVTASAIAIEKIITKKLLERSGVKMAKTYNSVEEIENFPVMIKPKNEGSSVGIALCKNIEEVNGALKNIKSEIMIEEYIKGEELSVGVLNGEALGVVRIIPKVAEIYDYEAKYSEGGSEHEFPARIPKKAYDEAMKNAVKAHEELGLKGISRSDFIMKDEDVYFLEVNTCPGLTETSLVPDLATLKGYSFDDLIKIMVDTFK